MSRSRVPTTTFHCFTELPLPSRFTTTPAPSLALAQIGRARAHHAPLHSTVSPSSSLLTQQQTSRSLHLPFPTPQSHFSSGHLPSLNPSSSSSSPSSRHSTRLPLLAHVCSRSSPHPRPSDTHKSSRTFFVNSTFVADRPLGPGAEYPHFTNHFESLS